MVNDELYILIILRVCFCPRSIGMFAECLRVDILKYHRKIDQMAVYKKGVR